MRQGFQACHGKQVPSSACPHPQAQAMANCQVLLRRMGATGSHRPGRAPSGRRRNGATRAVAAGGAGSALGHGGSGRQVQRGRGGCGEPWWPPEVVVAPTGDPGPPPSSSLAAAGRPHIARASGRAPHRARRAPHAELWPGAAPHPERGPSPTAAASTAVYLLCPCRGHPSFTADPTSLPPYLLLAAAEFLARRRLSWAGGQGGGWCSRGMGVVALVSTTTW